MSRYDAVMDGKANAIHSAQRAIPRIQKFCEENNMTMRDFEDSFCGRIISSNRYRFSVSLSYCKQMEWYRTDPNTTVVEIALWDPATQRVTYNARVGYEDVRLFDNLEDALDEVKRLQQFAVT